MQDSTIDPFLDDSAMDWRPTRTIARPVSAPVQSRQNSSSRTQRRPLYDPQSSQQPAVRIGIDGQAVPHASAGSHLVSSRRQDRAHFTLSDMSSSEEADSTQMSRSMPRQDGESSAVVPASAVAPARLPGYPD